MSIPISPDRRRLILQREARLLILALAFLALSSVALSLSAAVEAGDWSAALDRSSHLILLPLWAVIAWMGHRVLSRSIPGRDPFLFPSAMLLCGWGVLVVWRLLPTFGARQASWLLVAAVVLFEIGRRSDDLEWLQRYRYVWLIGGTLLTALTLIFGTNPSGGDPRLWLGCCGLYLQPSEVLRLLLVAFLASFFADRIAYRWTRASWSILPTILPLLILWTVSLALLAAQRDLGTGILFLALLASLIYLVSGRYTVILAALAFMLLAAWFASYRFDLVHARMGAWLQPWSDPSGNAYQLIQGLMGVAAGGILGQGPGLGSPGFVPAAHTDFIYASIVEEWGLMGGLATLALLFLLVHRGLKAAAMASSPFGFVLASGVSLMFGLQALMILGGVLRLVPLTGVTVPFISYGGSSLVTSFTGLAFLLHTSGSSGTPFARRYPPLKHLHAALSVGFLALAAASGWWVLVRGAGLLQRNDNPRRAVSQRLSPRGQLLDRDGDVLADTVGERGSYQRVLLSQASAAIVGYDSAAFGRSGAEALLDQTLRGLEGYPPQVTWWTQLLTGAPPPGVDVRLTVDRELQELTDDLMGRSPGAAVVIQAASGRILALQSQPGIDPNRLDEQVDELLGRLDAPLLNRATQASYQPGPLIAPLLAAVTLEDSKDLPDTVPGLGQPVGFLGGSRACAQVVGSDLEGPVGVGLRLGCPRAALSVSAGQGPGEFAQMMSTFALDERGQIDGPAVSIELPAIQPDTMEMEAIGQGELTLTPLQIARAFSALFHQGTLPAVRTVEAIGTPSGGWVSPTLGPAMRAVSERTAAAVTSLLADASGDRAYVCGLAMRGEEADLAWYVGADLRLADPPVVVLVLEGGGQARARAAGESLLQWLAQASLDPPPLTD